MIPELRKKSLAKFANFIANEFITNNITGLTAIAETEGIEVYYDHYDNSFDGMLVYDGYNFHLHINIDRGNLQDSPRGRFSFAHELAHYFIEEHRHSLMTGAASPHGSLHDFNHNDLIEDEADYFAASLLMPESTFRKIKTDKKFSFNTIIELSTSLHVSNLACLIRFCEIGSHPLMAVIAEKGKVKWYCTSSDFPHWKMRFKIGQVLPPTSVAGEYLINKIEYTSIQNIDPEDWFYPAWTPSTQMHEQCKFFKDGEYIISILWFD